MKTTAKPLARLLPLIAVLALLPFANWSCEDAGDEPGGPTGSASQYYPEMDTQTSKISVSAEGNFNPGGEFDLVVAFTDGDGRPAEGIPVVAQAEAGYGGVEKYFIFDTNPTLTNSAGRCSIPVEIAADCPPGSYLFMVYSGPAVGGPSARGYARVRVGGTGAGSAAVTSVTLTTTTPTVELVAGTGNAVFSIDVVKTDACSLVITYDAVGAGYSLSDSPGSLGLLSLPVSTIGTLTVQATAYCSEDPLETVISAPVSATVQDLVP